jgi:hypothetical protein
MLQFGYNIYKRALALSQDKQAVRLLQRYLDRCRIVITGDALRAVQLAKRRASKRSAKTDRTKSSTT